MTLEVEYYYPPPNTYAYPFSEDNQTLTINLKRCVSTAKLLAFRDHRHFQPKQRMNSQTGAYWQEIRGYFTSFTISKDGGQGISDF